MNVEVVDGAASAKTDSQDLAASLKQGFAQMSQDIARTIAESFKAFRSEFDLPNEDLAGEELEEIPHAVDEDHVLQRRNEVARLNWWWRDSAWAQKPPSNEGNFEVLNSL